MARKLRNAPKVGELASYGHGGDSYPYTVIAVSATGYKVTLQRRKAVSCKGHTPYDGQHRVLTVEDPDGDILVVRRRKDGKYYGRGSYARQPSVSFGRADYYLDPHF